MIDKEQQKKLLIEMMEEDQKTGLYDLVNQDIELTDQDVEIMIQTLVSQSLANIHPPNQKLLRALEQYKNTLGWKEVEEEYMKDNYPVFGGPFNDAMPIWEWLEKYYFVPVRK